MKYLGPRQRPSDSNFSGFMGTHPREKRAPKSDTPGRIFWEILYTLLENQKVARIET
jgi:hypothetical protein